MARKKRVTQSPNYKEYMRLRRNIIAQMKYREQQDYKVDYTTKPQIIQRPTKRDIENLKNYKIGLNKYGEVIADKPRSKALVQTSFKGITPSTLYNTSNTPDTHYYTEKQIDDDWETLIWEKIYTVRSFYLSLDVGKLYGHDIGNDLLQALMDAYGQIYNDLYSTMVDNENKYSEEERNNYFKSRWSEISSEFAKLLEHPPSDDTKVIELGNKIVDILKMS